MAKGGSCLWVRPQTQSLLSRQVPDNRHLPIFGESFLLQKMFPCSFSCKWNGLNQCWHLLQSPLLSVLTKSLKVSIFLLDFISFYKKVEERGLKIQLTTARSVVNEYSPEAFANLQQGLMHQKTKQGPGYRDLFFSLFFFLLLYNSVQKEKKKANNMQWQNSLCKVKWGVAEFSRKNVVKVHSSEQGLFSWTRLSLGGSVPSARPSPFSSHGHWERTRGRKAGQDYF